MNETTQLTEGQQGVIRMYDKEIEAQQVAMNHAKSAYDAGHAEYADIVYHREQINILTIERQRTLDRWAEDAKQADVDSENAVCNPLWWGSLSKTEQKALEAIRDCKNTFTPHMSKFAYARIEFSGCSARTAKKLAEYNLVRIVWGRNGKKVMGVRLTGIGWDLVKLDGMTREEGE